jgi:hypothetical protein
MNPRLQAREMDQPAPVGFFVVETARRRIMFRGRNLKPHVPRRFVS